MYAIRSYYADGDRHADDHPGAHRLAEDEGADRHGEDHLQIGEGLDADRLGRFERADQAVMPASYNFV